MSHSPSDFDKNLGYWSLDASQYVSAPTSLKMTRAPGYNLQILILHDSITGVMEQGRIASWCRTPYLGTTRLLCFVFRNMSPDGTAVTYPFYAVCFSQTAAYWRKYTAENTYTLLGTFPRSGQYWIMSNEWRCLRLSWWNGYDTSNNPATVCRLETSLDGVWKTGGDLYDTAQLNKGEAVQRCGVGYTGGETGVYCWCDDTEFWKAPDA